MGDRTLKVKRRSRDVLAAHARLIEKPTRDGALLHHVTACFHARAESAVVDRLLLAARVLLLRRFVAAPPE
jgi:hypothetical protein